MLSVILGIIILIISTEIMINNTIIISKKFRISLIVLSIIVHGVFTSLPELLISIKAANTNHPELIVSDVIGSNIINLTLILGSAAIIKPLYLKEKHGISTIFTILSVLLINISFLIIGEINIISGIVYILTFCFYIYLTLNNKTNNQDEESSLPENEDNQSIIMPVILICLSWIGIYIGPNMVINGSLELSSLFNISNEFIGIIIISLGTSLPELATSIQAQRQGRQEIIIGNIVGSNIFNILLILGISSFIIPVSLPKIMLLDLILMSALMIYIAIAEHFFKIGFKTGITLIIIELLYLIYVYHFIM